MNQYSPIANGYRAGRPERSGHTSLADGELSDAQVISNARNVYRKLQRTPRWSRDNDILIREWAKVCEEMNYRGITDSVTEAMED